MRMILKRTVLSIVICLSIGLSAQAEASSSATAVRAAGPLTIDGQLTEAAWEEAPANPPLVNPADGAAVPAERETTFKVVFDDENVYVGIRAGEPAPEELKMEMEAKIDAAVWNDDDVEVFIDTQGDRMEYYQFAVNCVGAKADLYSIEGGHTGKAGYHPEWEAVSFIGPDFFSVEMRIPFAALHVRTLKTGVRDWIVSVARQSLSGRPRYMTFNQASPNQVFHDPNSWGVLKGMEVPADIYQVSAGNAEADITKVGDGYVASISLNLNYAGAAPRAVTLRAGIEGRLVERDATLQPHESNAITLDRIAMDQLGKQPVAFSLYDRATGKLLLTQIAELHLVYEPLRITVREPAYRDNIYFSEDIQEIRASIHANLSPSELEGAVLETVFRRDKESLSRRTDSVSGAAPTVEVELPADNLEAGTYEISCRLSAASGEELAAAKKRIRKLGPPPGVEVRIDRQGATLINGTPILIRGWYGNLDYIVPSVSMAEIALPGTVNFMLTTDAKHAIRYGYYYLTGLSRTPGLEEAATREEALSEEIKEAVRATVRERKYDRQMIGYYLSDEPECRGLSPLTLKELYELVKEEDPYRLCLIVTRAPELYVEAADVVCPHAYINPIRLDDGRRDMVQSPDAIHRVMQTGYQAINGRAKGLWEMPQVFSYAGEGARSSRSMQPTFNQSRWQFLSALANHAQGIVPFIFDEYWNDPENRIGCTYLFETLAYLEPVWMDDSREIDVQAECNNEGAIDVLARMHEGLESPAHVYMAAANRSGTAVTARIAFEGMEDYPRLYVLREDRTIELTADGFVDDFEALGAHVYTTCDVLPLMKSLDEIHAEIDAVARRGRDENLLRNGSTEWHRGEEGRSAVTYGDRLADGFLAGAGWFPWYGNADELLLSFPNDVRFSRLAYYSDNIKDARLQIWRDGDWAELAEWNDIHTFKTEWTGEPVQTEKLRIVVDTVRDSDRPFNAYKPSITEIEMR